MKMRYTASSFEGRLVFECEVTDRKKAFEVLAAIQSVFEEPCCGSCQSRRIVCEVRPVENGSYYEMRCLDCTARLDIGQRKDGGLFVKRKDRDGNDHGKNGWYIWQGGGQQSDGQRQPSQPARSATRRYESDDEPPDPGNVDIPF
jgi:hypothetical protein